MFYFVFVLRYAASSCGSFMLPLHFILCFLLSLVQSSTIGVQFGSNIATVVAELTTSLLRNATNSTTIQVFPANVELNPTNIGAISVVLSFGSTSTRALVVAQSDLDVLGSEGYIIRSTSIGKVWSITHLSIITQSFDTVLLIVLLLSSYVIYCRSSTSWGMAMVSCQMCLATIRTYQMEPTTVCSGCSRHWASPSSILFASQCQTPSTSLSSQTLICIPCLYIALYHSFLPLICLINF